jgi:hypothetical protein
VESFPTQRKICNYTFDADSSNLAQGDSRDVCQQKDYAFGGLDQTPKIDKLGSDGIQQFTFKDVGSVRHS